MPARKSKGVSGASAMFGLSKLEHEKNGYGTQTVRYGRDAQIRFGWCALSLQPARDPVATPHGVIYDREVILHYLLERKVQLREAKKDYDAQQARIVAEREKSSLGQKAQQADEMRKRMTGAVPEAKGSEEASGASKGSHTFKAESSSNNSSANSGPAASSYTRLKKFSKEEIKNRILTYGRDTETIEEKKARLAETNFWMPEVYSPDAGPKLLEKPDKCPRCPITGKFLRSKQLYPVKFARDSTVTFGDPGNIVCSISQKAITHQHATLLRVCGHVLLSSLVKDLVVRNMRCPACNAKIKHGKDLINLKQGGTSFSSHSKVQTSKYRPNVR